MFGETDPSKGRWCGACETSGTWELRGLHSGPGGVVGRYVCPHGCWFDRAAPVAADLAPGVRRVSERNDEPIWRLR